MTTFHAYHAMTSGQPSVVVRFPDAENKGVVVGEGRTAEEAAIQLIHEETGLALDEINVEIATATKH